MFTVIGEAQKVAEAARRRGVMTQMGNQGHAAEGARLTNEWIQAGVIGEVAEVHVWTDRPGHAWPQGTTRPAGTPPVPATLDWDLWLGPAPVRPYHPTYVPAQWRGFWDFGTGAIGDMGCHIIDHPYWALKLGSPDAVQARITTIGSSFDDKPNRETYPVGSIIYYSFPARGSLCPVRMTWYDGGLMPARPAGMPSGENLPGNGALYVGSKGALWHGSHGGMPNLAPGELYEEARLVPKTIPRSDGHWKEWVDACKGGPPPVSNFSYAGPLTEVVLLGNLATRAPGQRIEWDGTQRKAINLPELNQFVHKEYRKSW
jgi:predicted dehydrogenase